MSKQHTTDYELAQINLAELKAPLDSPQLADFVANLDRINALAETSPGFLWRLQTEEGDATAASHPFGDKVIVNMSVWKDVESLNHYVYRTVHVEIMRRRREWFERMRQSHMVLWWVPRGHRPTVAEAAAKLELLRTRGATPDAFDFRHAYPPPDESRASEFGFLDECPAT